MLYFHCSIILTLRDCNRSGDYEESVIGFVTHRDRSYAVQKTVDIYKNIARRKKKQMELAKTKANNWKIKRDSLEYGKKKMRATLFGSGKVTRIKDKDKSYVDEDDDNSSNSSDTPLGEEERNAMEELTEMVRVDVSGVPSLEAIAQLTDQMAVDVDIKDGSE